MQTFQQFKEKLLREDASDLEKEDALEAADEWLNSEIRKHKGVVRDLTEVQRNIISNYSYEEIINSIDRIIAREQAETDPEERQEYTLKAMMDLRNAIFNKSL